MKTIIQILTLFLFVSELHGQITEVKCGTMEYLQLQKKSDPKLKAKLLLHEEQMQQWIKEYYNPDSLEVITIPIVVHIVYNTDEQNVSDQRVFEQIDFLNRDFAGLRTQSMEAFPDSLKANTGIQFCLAQKAPDGYPTNGIERRYSTDTAFGFNNAVKFYKNGGLDAWDPSKYLNIWVCNLNIGGSGGYAQYPGTGNNETYGAVIYYIYFGGTGARAIYNMGGMTTHELGHCFNLNHIWGDDYGACTGTDHCDDTPNQANATNKFHSGILTDSCSPISPGIMYMNFMDYAYDSVYANFTPDQTARMQACFASPNGPLQSLANSDACSPPTPIETPTAPAYTDIILFPNPADGFITIKGITGNVKFIDIMGREVWRGKISDGNRISICDFNPGIYYIVSEESARTKKCLIVR